MATTTNFGWETPDDTDLVKDGALAMRTLGNSIDTSMAELKGGTTGQILSKTSNTDMDFTWINNDQGDITAVTAGTGISGGGTSGAVTITNAMATEITAAGDIIVGTGSATFDNLPIGTTGQVLTADTTVSPYKVKWATPASGSTFAGARVKKTASQTISNNTTTTITWNDEDFDTNTYHDNTTNNSRFTIPSGKAGYYQIIGNICTGGSNPGARVIEIYKNTTRIDRVDREPVTNQNNIITNTIFEFAVGDYIEAKIYQDSGGNISVVTDSRFSIVYLGA